jgi:HlyD family secretion protein
LPRPTSYGGSWLGLLSQLPIHFWMSLVPTNRSHPRCYPKPHPVRAVILWVLFLSTSSGLTTGLGACAGPSQSEPTTPAAIVPTQAPRVVALGRLGPIGGVIKLSVPNAADSRVNQILVREGDSVTAGQVIAILQGSDRREQDLAEATKTVAYYQAKLDQARAGTSKQAELAAQREAILRLEAQQRTEGAEREATIAIAQADLREAEASYQRQSDLARSGAVSRQSLDQARRSLDSARATLTQRRAQLANSQQTLQAQIRQSQATLDQLQEVRPVDIQVAQTEVDRAKIAVAQRRADLEDTRVRVPIPGQILRINTKVGEQVNTQQGIVELGKTDQMYALAEVYETQIGQVKKGQRALIRSEYGGFVGEIQGEVEQVGLQITNPQLQASGNNPTNDENTRIVQVHIRIASQDSPKVAGLTNMQVRIEIETGLPPKSGG